MANMLVMEYAVTVAVIVFWFLAQCKPMRRHAVPSKIAVAVPASEVAI